MLGVPDVRTTDSFLEPGYYAYFAESSGYFIQKLGLQTETFAAYIARDYQNNIVFVVEEVAVDYRELLKKVVGGEQLTPEDVREIKQLRAEVALERTHDFGTTEL